MKDFLQRLVSNKGRVVHSRGAGELALPGKLGTALKDKAKTLKLHV